MPFRCWVRPSREGALLLCTLALKRGILRLAGASVSAQRESQNRKQQLLVPEAPPGAGGTGLAGGAARDSRVAARHWAKVGPGHSVV